MTPSEILNNLRQRNFGEDILIDALKFTGQPQEKLFELARQKRSECFPENQVQVRSVIETSNICRQKCRYCSIGGKDQKLNYSLDAQKIGMLISYLYKKGRRNILLQSGENISEEFVEETAVAVSKAKNLYPDLRIILCMGDLSFSQYEKLFKAGASDYILKFEASNERLFEYCKPNDTLSNRLDCISNLAEIGYRVGSGNIVGLPTQTLEDLADDLILIHKLPLKMNSSTIFIPAENSDFANQPAGNPNYTLNMMALMRIMNPDRLMPTTSSLEKMIPDGQFLGLQAGANTVTIHDGTPEELHKYFPIYSTKRVRPQIQHFKEILERAGIKTDNLKDEK